MLHIKRKLGIVLISLCVLIVSLTGCNKFENTEIVFTTGLSKNQLFKVGGAVCTLPEAMIYVRSTQGEYETTYGIEMWNHDFGGVTLEKYVKDNIVTQLASIKAVTLLAEEYKVTLSESEKRKIEEATAIYYESLSQEDLEYMEVTKSDIEKLYQDHLLANKIYKEVTKDVNVEVSDDEARIITVQQMKFKTEEEAKEAMLEVEAGEDFQTVAATKNRNSQITYTFGRNEKEAKYEEVAFNLGEEEISQIFQSGDGFYIMKCIDNFNKEATAENKIILMEQAQNDTFEEVYQNLIDGVVSEFNQKIWDKVKFESLEKSTAINFLEVYEDYIG